MGTKHWDGTVADGLWMSAGNWEENAIPIHGDDVRFEGARLVGTRCTTGPTSVVLLNSIYADLAYDGGVNAAVCYPKCGMDGAPVATVTIDGDSKIIGGVIETANLNHDAASWATAARASIATIATLNLNGKYTATAGDVVAMMATINCIGDYSRIAGRITCTAATMTGRYNETQASGGYYPDITTLTCWGDDACIRGGAIATAHFYGDRCYHPLTSGVCGTLHIYGAACLVSLLGIAAGKITNGPYLCGWAQKLYDYDTDNLICDMSQLPLREGEW